MGGLQDAVKRVYDARFERGSIDFVEAICDGVRSGGRVLDLGSGKGRYSIPLLIKGFHVTAVDIDGAAIECLVEDAKRRGLRDNLIPIKGDIRNEEIVSQLESYDAILCMNVLQFLNEKGVNYVLGYIMERTAADGLNAVASFLDAEGLDIEKLADPSRFSFLFKSGQLERAYSGWKIRHPSVFLPGEYLLINDTSRTNAEPHSHLVTEILAQKPQDKNL